MGTINEVGMKGYVLHDGSLKATQQDGLVEVMAISPECLQVDVRLHPFDSRWFIYRCMWSRLFKKFEYVALTYIGDVRFFKNLALLFRLNKASSLFLMQETDIGHEFQTSRFEACWNDMTVASNELPFNGGFVAGSSTVMESLVQSIEQEMNLLLHHDMKRCLELSCDQAVLNKIVYGEMQKGNPYSLGDLHPPYAMKLCTQSAKRMYYVAHKNVFVESLGTVECSKLLADAYWAIG